MRRRISSMIMKMKIMSSTRSTYSVDRKKKRKKRADICPLKSAKTNNVLEYIRFDAYDDRKTIEMNMRLSSSLPSPSVEIIIGGILLNAGGFGDGKSSTNSSRINEKIDGDDRRRACDVAQVNIIGHVNLVNYLISTYKMDDISNKTRIVAVGSEASFASPGIKMNYTTANFVDHLSGAVPVTDRSFGINYGWTKGILALYWAAFSRHHPELYVVTVSPGAVSNTNLFSHDNVSPFLRGIARLSQCLGGSHTVEEGAKRYIDALFPITRSSDDDNNNDNNTDEQREPEPSGSFLASRKGFI